MKIYPRILLVGNLKPQDFEFCWWQWLRAQSYPILTIDPTYILNNSLPSSVQAFFWRFLQDPLVLLVSQQFIKAALSFQPELILVVSGHLISSIALKTVRNETNATIYHFYGEDFFNPLNTNQTLKATAFLYDHLFTTKRFNVSELAEIGLEQVSYIPHGYRPNCHFPVTVSLADRQEYGSDLTFVGTYELERASTLAQLKEFDLRIWGSSWHKAKGKLGLFNAIQKRPIYCEEMSRVFNASKICLAFLRKANRDRHTSRTFEIPACGGFQLSERTEDILEFFEEGKEIECFESVDELKDKSNFYLKHESQRQRLALAGNARVQRSSYSYTDRLQSILQHYSNSKSL